MATSRTTLKTYFENGDTPDESQFAELIDAFQHADEAISIRFSKGVQFKATGNVNPGSDEDGDWRIRMNAGGSLLMEKYDESTTSWQSAQEFDL